MYSEYYISALRISKDIKGNEYISHVKAHAKIGNIIKEQGQTFDKDLVLNMMPRALFFTARKTKSQWTLRSRLNAVEDEDGYFIIVDPSDIEVLPEF